MPKLQALLWLCLAAYGFHILEEFAFDWRNWARHVLHLPAEWTDFYVTNSLVVVIGIVGAEIGPLYPQIALGFPAVMIINALFFHMAPFIWTRGRFSPGLMTAVCLFLPLGIETFRVAQLGATGYVIAFTVGAFELGTPIIFVAIRHRPYFDQTR